LFDLFTIFVRPATVMAWAVDSFDALFSFFIEDSSLDTYTAWLAMGPGISEPSFVSWKMHIATSQWGIVHAKRIHLVVFTFVAMFTLVFGTEPSTFMTFADVAIKDPRFTTSVEFTVKFTFTVIGWDTFVSVISNKTVLALTASDALVFAFKIFSNSSTRLSTRATAFFPFFAGSASDLTHTGVFPPVVH